MKNTNEPVNLSKDLAHMTGLEQMKMAFQHEDFRPAMGKTLDFTLQSVEYGVAIFEGFPSEAHLNPIGSVHGGYAATLLDSALGCSVHTVLDPGERYTTIDLNVKYIRAIAPNMGKLICRADVVHKGRKMATSEARLVDENGKIYAHGNTTCIILS